MMAPQAFVLRIADEAIADLKARLSLTRFPDAAPGEPWAYGTSVDYILDLVSYWKDRFDWRAQEAALNEFPQFKVLLHDIDLHFLHAPGVGPLWRRRDTGEGRRRPRAVCRASLGRRIFGARSHSGSSIASASAETDPAGSGFKISRCIAMTEVADILGCLAGSSSGNVSRGWG